MSRPLSPSSIPRPGRDIVPRSRPLGRLSQVATSIPCRDLPSAQPKQSRSRPQNGVATPTSMGQPEPCRDIKSVLRHHSGHSRSRPQKGVATPFLLPSPNPGRNTKTRSRPSWRLPYVATSISCCDLVSAHSGISRSRRQTPSRDLPHCYPCRDLKNDVATSNPTG